jgi:hypothetical protein
VATTLSGYYLILQTATDYIVASVNGTPTDGTGYWTVPLTLIHTGTIFTDTDQMRVSVEWAGSNAAGGIADGTTTGELLYWTGTQWQGSDVGTVAELQWTPGSSQLRIGDGTTGQFDISVSGNIGTIDASSLSQVTLAAGKFRLGTSNAKLEMREHTGGVAAPSADSGYMMADSITWSDITPSWVDENSNVYPMANPDGHWFQFSTLTSAADPTSGYIRFNSATPASVTNLYIDDLNHHGNDEDSMLSNLADGDLIRIRSANLPDTVYWMGTVNGTPTDNTGWWTVPVTHIDSGTLPSSNTALQLEVQWLSQAGSGGITGTVADNQVVTGTGASTVDSSANLTYDGTTLTMAGASAQLILPQNATPLAPTLAFGDGDTGFYELSDDTMRVSIAGSELYQFSATHISGTASASFYLRNTTVTSTNPSLGPRRDTNTGIGSAENDSMSLIAGGAEFMRFDGAVGGQDMGAQ